MKEASNFEEKEGSFWQSRDGQLDLTNKIFDAFLEHTGSKDLSDKENYDLNLKYSLGLS